MFKLYDNIQEMISHDINVLIYLFQRYKIDSTILFFYSKYEPNIQIRITDKIFKIKIGNKTLFIVILYFTTHKNALIFEKKMILKNHLEFIDIIDINKDSSVRNIINNLLTNPLFVEISNEQ